MCLPIRHKRNGGVYAIRFLAQVQGVFCGAAVYAEDFQSFGRAETIVAHGRAWWRGMINIVGVVGFENGDSLKNNGVIQLDNDQ